MQNNDTLEIAAFISGIINIVMLIVFCVMASNVSAIKKILEAQRVKNLNWSNAFNNGALKEYQGKNQEALDCYMEAYYRISKVIPTDANDGGVTLRSWERNKDAIKSKITTLGGTVKEIQNKT